MTTTDLGSDSGTLGSAAQATDRAGGGPVGGIVLTSLLTGIVGAGVLTLGLVAGATEHVITGSALLAFAAGWAVLAGLTSRMTDSPQRWAYLPAAVLTSTGLGLLLVAPDDAALTSAGYVWAPALLALTGWTAVQLRRSMHSRVSWLLYPALAAAAVAA